MSSDSGIDASLAATLEAETVLRPEDRCVTFDNVAGLTTAKEALVGAQTSRRSVLLFGPPGTGKTHLLKAAEAHASGTTVLQMNISIMIHFTKQGIRGDAVIEALFHVARRMDLLKIHTTGLDFDEGIDIERVAEVTEGYSGADLVVLCRDAAMQPLRRLMAGKTQEEVAALAADMDSTSLKVSRENFVEAVQRSRRSVGPEDVRRFQFFESAAS